MSYQNNFKRISVYYKGVFSKCKQRRVKASEVIQQMYPTVVEITELRKDHV